MEQMQGVWILESSENFGDYLKAMGIGKILRMAAKLLTPETLIEIKGDKFKTVTLTSLKNVSLEATFDEVFTNNTPDGRTAETVVVREGDKVVQRENWEGKETRIVRYINQDGKLQVEMYKDDVVCKRVYIRK